MGWEEENASIADWAKLRIVGGEQGPDFNVPNCMVNVMEGEGQSDRLSDMLWSGLGIRGQARKLRLWFIKCEERCSPKKGLVSGSKFRFLSGNRTQVSRGSIYSPGAGAYTANALTSGLNIYFFLGCCAEVLTRIEQFFILFSKCQTLKYEGIQ